MRAGCLMLVLAAHPGRLVAQRMEGLVVDGRSDQPIAGAFVVLHDSTGTERSRVMTDALGAFAMAVPEPGLWSVEAVAVGHARYESTAVSIATGQTIQLHIRLSGLAVALPALVVNADRQCRVRPGSGEAAGTLWEEARKALDAIAWSNREGVLQFEYARFRRTRDPRDLHVRSAEVTRRQGWYRGSPFVSTDLTTVIEEGFVRELPEGGWVYSAPDADVLLSEAFADSHCFFVADPGDGPVGLVGLAFEPVFGRDVSDLEGRLWLDGETAELRLLEYRYTRLPLSLRDRRVGGRIEFRRLPDGPWIVDDWWIRMPVLGKRQPRRGAYEVREQIVVLSYVDEGGWVDRARRASGAVVWRARTAMVEGLVRRTRGARPVKGIEVYLMGSRLVTHTEADGTFRFDSVVPGRYHVVLGTSRARPPILEPPHAVELGWADTVQIELEVEDANRVAALRCPDLPSNRGMLAGLARVAASGGPLIGATVTVLRDPGPPDAARDQVVLAVVVTDLSGYYRVCGVPLGERVLLRLTTVEADTLWAEARIDAGRAGRIDWDLASSR